MRLRAFFKLLAVTIIGTILSQTLQAAGWSTWMGYNVARGYSDIDKVVSDLAAANQTAGYEIKGPTSKTGGLSYGMDFMFDFAGLELGVGASYIPLYNLEYSANKPNASVTMRGTLGAFPVMGLVRFPLGGFFIGGGAGYSFGLGRVFSFIDGTIKTKASQTTGLTTTNTETTTGPDGHAWAAMGMAGYNFIDQAPIRLGIAVRYYVILENTSLTNIVPLVHCEVVF
jgi:hypothetical protein